MVKEDHSDGYEVHTMRNFLDLAIPMNIYESW